MSAPGILLHAKSPFNGILRKNLSFEQVFTLFLFINKTSRVLFLCFVQSILKEKEIFWELKILFSKVIVIFALLFSLTCNSHIRQMSTNHKWKVRGKGVLFSFLSFSFKRKTQIIFVQISEIISVFHLVFRFYAQDE